jgi:enterochelin esterase-like enzyme
MYRTGDVGRYLASGAIDILGRADHQVKIRGYRIETSEIEHTLLRHNDITSAVVIRAELETGPALVAYVVATVPVDVTALRSDLRDTLPAYMVPDHIVELPQFTLTVNNKVDRLALPPVTAAEPDQADNAPPATGLDARVADAWSTVLGRTLPATADFFDNGGHSLLVPRATAAVRQLLGREIPLRLMMDNRAPSQYAAAILRESRSDVGAASRAHRLDQQLWHSKTLDADLRVDLFVSAENRNRANENIRTLVVLDGSEFVDIMRLPAILDRLVLEDRIPTTAAVFISPTEFSARNRELLDDGYVDVLADELIPHLRSWLGERWQAGRSTAVGASLGAIVALRAALRRQDCFEGAVALSGPLTEHRLGTDTPGEHARLFLSASREEADITLDDGLSLLEATTHTGKELTAQGHTVRCAYGEGGHTYAAWEAMLPQALPWALSHPAEDR